MRKLILGLFLLSSSLGALAQGADSAGRWRFSSTISAGYLGGQSGVKFAAEAVAGVQRRGLFLGAGAGLDYYTYRTVPVFLQVRQDLRRQGHTPFAYLSGGPAFPWLRDEEQLQNPWEERGTFRRGPFLEGGLGIAFRLKKYQALSLSAGYSYKGMTERRIETAPCFAPPCPQYERFFTYDLRRVAVRAGWRLF